MPPKESGENKKQVLPQEPVKSNGDEHVREHSGVKRAREGSQEPTPSPNPTVAATKKNRLGLESTAEGTDEPTPDSAGRKESTSSTSGKETRNVGEVRKKVEEMNWKEGQSKSKPLGEGWEEIKDEEAKEAKANARSDDVEQESSSGEKGDLKRKALERNESSMFAEEPAKKAKETPSPPPTTKDTLVEESAPPAPAAAPAPVPAKKPQSSFSAFSSSASPFSAARSSSPFASASASGSASGSGSKSATSAFGNYSASSSPFARKPAPADTVSASTAAPSEVKDDAEAGPSTPAAKAETKTEIQPQAKASTSTSFGDILKESKADEEDTGDKVQMTEKDVHTGEEDEETIYQTRAKLYVMQSDGGWKERGVGTLRLNVRASDGKGARLVMRAEGVLRLILNISLYVGMTVLEDGKHVRSTVFEDKERRLVTFRLGSQKAASELCANIQDYIPLESTTKSPVPAAPSPSTVTA